MSRSRSEPAEGEKILERIQSQLDVKNENIADLERLHGEVTKYWSNIKLQRNIGYVEYAPAVKVDEGRTNYTTDWGVFLAAEAKVKDAFEGNVVDLGAKYSPPQLAEMFYPLGSGRTTFRYPKERKLRIFGCATREDLATPVEFDNEGQRCLMVGKDGNTTDLTVGHFSGPESFTRNAVGVKSRELAIYNSGNKTVEVFSAKGDSGSLVWHMKDDMARIVGQIHSGGNKLAARPIITLPTALPDGTSWLRSRGSSGTPTSIAPLGRLADSLCVGDQFHDSASSLPPCPHSPVLIDCESFPPHSQLSLLSFLGSRLRSHRRWCMGVSCSLDHYSGPGS